MRWEPAEEKQVWRDAFVKRGESPGPAQDCAIYRRLHHGSGTNLK
jgi:hypothetical protein